MDDQQESCLWTSISLARNFLIKRTGDAAGYLPREVEKFAGIFRYSSHRNTLSQVNLFTKHKSAREQHRDSS